MILRPILTDRLFNNQKWLSGKAPRLCVERHARPLLRTDDAQRTAREVEAVEGRWKLDANLES